MSLVEASNSPLVNGVYVARLAADSPSNSEGVDIHLILKFSENYQALYIPSYSLPPANQKELENLCKWGKARKGIYHITEGGIEVLTSVMWKNGSSENDFLGGFNGTRSDVVWNCRFISEGKLTQDFSERLEFSFIQW